MKALAILALTASLFAATNPPVTLHGYILDSACAFTRNLAKPISPECATACAKAGSPLVLLSGKTIYWPIDHQTPAHGQNDRLLQFAGRKVTVTGSVTDRGGSKAIVIKTVALE